MAQAGLQNRAELANVVIFAVVVRALHLDIDGETIFGGLNSKFNFLIDIQCLNQRMVFHNMTKVIYCCD